MAKCYRLVFKTKEKLTPIIVITHKDGSFSMLGKEGPNMEPYVANRCNEMEEVIVTETKISVVTPVIKKAAATIIKAKFPKYQDLPIIKQLSEWYDIEVGSPLALHVKGQFTQPVTADLLKKFHSKVHKEWHGTVKEICAVVDCKTGKVLIVFDDFSHAEMTDILLKSVKDMGIEIHAYNLAPFCLVCELVVYGPSSMENLYKFDEDPGDRVLMFSSYCCDFATPYDPSISVDELYEKVTEFDG